MALDAGNVRVYCRGVDLSTMLQNTTLEQLREEADATAYADLIRKMEPTLGRISLAHAGIYGEGAFSLAEVFRQARDADDEPITIAPVGAVAGEKAFIVLAHKANLSLPESIAPGGIHKASLRAASRFAMGDGVVGLAGAVNGDSQTAAYQLGAVLAGQQVFATVHLLAMTGTPSVVFFLESDNGVGFPSAVIQATSAAQVARGSVLLQANGPISDDFWRIRWDHSGAGTFTALIALGAAG